MYFVFSVLGLIGGLLCCTGDILFDLKGKGNEKRGTSKNIDSNWLKMADWRFGLSIALAMIGDALVGLGFYSIGMQIADLNHFFRTTTRKRYLSAAYRVMRSSRRYSISNAPNSSRISASSKKRLRQPSSFR